MIENNIYTILGCLIMIFSFLLYENEEKKLINFIQNSWLEIDDKKNLFKSLSNYTEIKSIAILNKLLGSCYATKLAFHYMLCYSTGLALFGKYIYSDYSLIYSPLIFLLMELLTVLIFKTYFYRFYLVILYNYIPFKALNYYEETNQIGNEWFVAILWLTLIFSTYISYHLFNYFISLMNNNSNTLKKIFKVTISFFSIGIVFIFIPIKIFPYTFGLASNLFGQYNSEFEKYLISCSSLDGPLHIQIIKTIPKIYSFLFIFGIPFIFPYLLYLIVFIFYFLIYFLMQILARPLYAISRFEIFQHRKIIFLFGLSLVTYDHSKSLLSIIKNLL